VTYLNPDSPFGLTGASGSSSTAKTSKPATKTSQAEPSEIQDGNQFEGLKPYPGATVVIDDEPVPSVSADSSFKHFTCPLPHKGKNIITITAHARSGDSKTLKREVYTKVAELLQELRNFFTLASSLRWIE
jgi:hypothetical protein